MPSKAPRNTTGAGRASIDGKRDRAAEKGVVMLIHVTQADFDRAAETLPSDAFPWMHQEFAANFALQRAFPSAGFIEVDQLGIEIDRIRYRRPSILYRRNRPYRFKLSQSRFLVGIHDLIGVFYRGE